MDPEPLIKAIRTDLETIQPGVPEAVIRLNILSVIRNINRLNLISGNKLPALLKLAADIKGLYDSQLAFNKMNLSRAGTEQFDESFFRSLKILKKELFILLEKIRS